MAKNDLTAARLREILNYNPDTGVFTWRVKPHKNASSVVVGGVAGNVDDQGYIRIYIGRFAHKAHRLAWMYVTGEPASSILDHINGDRTDNRFDNLRLATRSLNNQNRKYQSRSKRTSLGVFLTKKGDFTARISVTICGRKLSIHLGTYATEKEAFDIYAGAKSLLHPEAWTSRDDQCFIGATHPATSVCR
jgi:hypothetical protein